MNFFVIQASRIRVARLFLLFGMIIGSVATLSSLYLGMTGEAIGGIVSILVTPVILWLSTKPRFKYLPNIAAIIITLSFSLGSAFMVLHQSEGLVWLGVVPIMYFYLTNRFIGLVLSLLTIAAYIISFVFYESIHGIAPVNIGVLGQAIAVYLYATLLSWLYETEWTGIQTKLRELSDRDYLTGIMNRRAVMRSIEASISNYERKKTPFSLILFDIDNFKKINDSHGHEVGDHVLKEMVSIIESNIRCSDIFGRWGGEEFIIICNSQIDKCYQLAEKLCAELSVTDFKYIKHLSASFGVAQYRGNESISEMIDRADGHLYDAKKTKNCVMCEDILKIANYPNT
ncbi:MAG: GGDEF domain-containing protein [Gammaproteobacteria bacterium]|nr:GGDEF domain-containing protein [Gammaproteobacteria bacterium]